MSKPITIIWLIVILGLTLAMPNGYALAYLDPGSGSLIIQLLIAGLLGLAVAGRLFWNQLLTLLRIKKPRQDDIDEDDDVE